MSLVLTDCLALPYNLKTHFLHFFKTLIIKFEICQRPMRTSACALNCCWISAALNKGAAVIT